MSLFQKYILWTLNLCLKHSFHIFVFKLQSILRVLIKVALFLRELWVSTLHHYDHFCNCRRKWEFLLVWYRGSWQSELFTSHPSHPSHPIGFTVMFLMCVRQLSLSKNIKTMDQDNGSSQILHKTPAHGIALCTLCSFTYFMNIACVCKSTAVDNSIYLQWTI